MECYIYQAELWCVDCGEAIKRRLIKEGKAPENPDDEYSYDSDDFPKGPMECGESDSPCHCGSGEECLVADVLPSGRKIGCWLKNELSPDGIEYVREAVRKGGEVADYWAECYRGWYLDFTEADDDDESEELSKEDWTEIYYALDSKLRGPLVTGDSSLERRWRQHLKRIMDVIGRDGENMWKDGES